MQVDPPLPRVLFVHFGEAALRGSEQLLLDLMAGLDGGRFKPVLWCNHAALAQAAEARGIATHCSPMRFVYDARALTTTVPAVLRQMGVGARLVRQYRPAVVHVNNGAPVQWMAPVCRQAGVPLLAHLHSPYLRRNRFNQLLHLAPMIAGVSEACLAGLRQDGVPAERLRLIPNGVDGGRLALVGRQPARQRFGLPPAALVVGVAGSLIARKQTDVVLRAVARLHGPAPVWLLVAGDGPERAALQTLAGVLGIGERTVFIGPYDAPGPVFAAMDVNVLASSDEAFGLVLVEAALCGVPSVGSRVGGVSEVIADGQTGLLVNPGDVAGFAAAVQALLDDPERRAVMGEAARDRAAMLFSAQRMAADFVGVYETLLMRPCGWRSLWADAGSYRALLRSEDARR